MMPAAEPETGGRWRRAHTAVLALVASLAMLAAVWSAAQNAGNTSRATRDSYESDVFPPYHAAGLPSHFRAPSPVALRHALIGKGYSSSVFPTYSAYEHDSDASGMGESYLRRAQSEAYRVIRRNQHDWSAPTHYSTDSDYETDDASGMGDTFLHRAQTAAYLTIQRNKRGDRNHWSVGAEYQSAKSPQLLAGGEDVTARPWGGATAQQRANGVGVLEDTHWVPSLKAAATSLARAQAAAASLARAQSAAQSPVIGMQRADSGFSGPRSLVRDLAHKRVDRWIARAEKGQQEKGSAPASAQKLYIPAIYNDKIDPEQEMEDMMKEFTAIIDQITVLESQMKCAAACANSTVNISGLDVDTGMMEVSFDDSHKNVSGGVLDPAADDPAAVACLGSCGIDEAILNNTFKVEETTKDKLHAVLNSMWAEQQAVLSRRVDLEQQMRRQTTPRLNQLARMSPKAGTRAAASAGPRRQSLSGGNDDSAKILNKGDPLVADDTAVVVNAPAHADHLIKAADAFFHRTHPQEAKSDKDARGGDIHLSTAADAFFRRGHHADPEAQSDDEAHGWKPPPKLSVFVAKAAAARKADEAKAAAAANADKAAADTDEAGGRPSGADAAARAWKPPPKLSVFVAKAAAARKANEAAAVETAKAHAKTGQASGRTSGADMAARAWKPPPPVGDVGTVVAADDAAEGMPAARAGAPGSRRTAARMMQRWLGGRNTAQTTSLLQDELIDWQMAPVSDGTIALPGQQQPAGSWTTDNHLSPPRDTVRYTTGRPGDISRHSSVGTSLPQKSAGHAKGRGGSGGLRGNEPTFDGFL